MPEIRLYYRHGLLYLNEIEEIKRLARAECISRYSTDQIKLTNKNFRFFVEQCAPPSELDGDCDVVIRIELHASKERLGNDEHKIDRDSDEIADIICNIRPLIGPQAIRVGVELVFAIIGWGTSDPLARSR